MAIATALVFTAVAMPYPMPYPYAMPEDTYPPAPIVYGPATGRVKIQVSQMILG